MFGWKRKIEAEISNLYVLLAQKDAVIASLTTNMASLRGLINRKLSGKSSSADEEETSDSYLSEAAIDKIRKAYGGELPFELMQRYKND